MLLCYFHSTRKHFLADTKNWHLRKSLKEWRSQRDSNPRYSLERAPEGPCWPNGLQTPVMFFGLQIDELGLLAKVVLADVRVALGRRETRVTHQDLQRTQRHARHDEMCPVGVPQ